MYSVQNKKCRNCKLLTFVGFCVFLRIICVLLRLFCVHFVCGLEHLGINRPNIAIQRTKVQYTFAIRGRVVGPCLHGGAGVQKKYMHM